MLRRIAKNEGFDFDDNILKLIANHSENSFRDAAKILEEVSFQKIKTVDELEKFLGIRGKSDLMEIIEKKDLKQTLNWINIFSENGGDFKNLIEDILNDLHLQLLIKNGAGESEAKKVSFTISEISLLIKLLLEAYQNLRNTPIDSLPIEIALIEFYNKSIKN